MNDEATQPSDDAKLTKAERKRQRREEKQQQREAEAKARQRKKTSTWLGFLVIIVVIVGGTVWAVRNGGSEDNGGHDTSGSVASVSQDDWVKGNPDATVTVTEYADFQCPACASFHPILQQLEDEFGDRVQFVFRHYPITQIHPNAEPAAVAAEAAGLQDRFWEMHDLLFERQDSWAQLRNTDDTFIGYAAELELDIAQFETDLENSELADKVEDQRRSGIQANVTGTPTFYLNGEKIDTPRSYGAFASLLTDALGEDATDSDDTDE